MSYNRYFRKVLRNCTSLHLCLLNLVTTIYLLFTRFECDPISASSNIAYTSTNCLQRSFCYQYLKGQCASALLVKIGAIAGRVTHLLKAGQRVPPKNDAATAVAKTGIRVTICGFRSCHSSYCTSSVERFRYLLHDLQFTRTASVDILPTKASVIFTDM